MKKIFFFLILHISLSFFSINIYFNTYDNTIIINGEIYPFFGKPNKFRGKIISYFKSPNVENFEFPDNLLVLEDGQTIGKNGTIKVSKDVFQSILKLYKISKITQVVIDEFPIELYDEKIIVKKITPKDKLKEYLDLFLKEYEIPNLKFYFGEYKITPKPPKIDITTFSFPEYGFYKIRINDYGKIQTKVYINNTISPNAGALLPGTYTIFVYAKDELGNESSLTKNLFVPKSTINFQEKEYEFFSHTKYGTLTFIGTKNFYEISPSNSTITTITVKDTTPPKVLLEKKHLFDNYYEIKVISQDFNKTKTLLKINNQEKKGEIFKLKYGKNIIAVYCEDTFKNNTLKLETIYINEKNSNSLQFFDQKKWFNIGGIMIKSPFIKIWINPKRQRRHYEDKNFVIHIVK
ncbi:MULTISPECIES: hypothetical protein [unclassified Thermosipho (in: thermotogales)]|uniref:hypothetical protein n=1 Tax=unclassified Thermosipho (in: thermotogales) TaxID=2676525 RepID=UPI0009866760|nr:MULTISPECIES: hypothetical protein [unclassified Thermosipho (in: thermotogales)]MBT1248011.1 hypothetical protein [Thermosipho sp. 1244]OOC46606.1 hypothetical protein XO09_05545 [Thermosipho sp. 1223]